MFYHVYYKILGVACSLLFRRSLTLNFKFSLLHMCVCVAEAKTSPLKMMCDITDTTVVVRLFQFCSHV